MVREAHRNERRRRSGVVIVVLGLATLGLQIGTAPASAVNLVRNFSSDGKVVSDFGDEFEAAEGMAAQPGGGFVVAGTAYAQDSAVRSHILLVSYKRNGKLDRAFGDEGVVVTTVATRTKAEAVAVQPDGKLVVAGSAKEPDDDSDVVLARYNPDGSLDPSFGSGGVVIGDFVQSAGAARHHIPASVDYALDAAIQADGRIVVAGAVDNGAALIRYLPNGAPDESFGVDGVVRLVAGFDPFQAVEALPDGRLLAGGGTSSGATLLVRYLPNGAPDPSFSADGIVGMPFSPCAIARDIAVDAQGRVVVAGSVGGCGELPPNATLARYSPDGELDPTFSGDGLLELSDTNASSLGFALENGTKPILAATAYGFLPREDDFLIARFRSDGKRDRSFSDGRVTTDFNRRRDAARTALIIGRRLVVVGQTVHAGNTALAVACYRLDR